MKTSTWIWKKLGFRRVGLVIDSSSDYEAYEKNHLNIVFVSHRNISEITNLFFNSHSWSFQSPLCACDEEAHGGEGWCRVEINITSGVLGGARERRGVGAPSSPLRPVGQVSGVPTESGQYFPWFPVLAETPCGAFLFALPHQPFWRRPWTQPLHSSQLASLGMFLSSLHHKNSEFFFSHTCTMFSIAFTRIVFF